MFNSNDSSIWNSKGAIKHLNFSDLDLTSQGHPRSKVVMSKERPHMFNSNYGSILNYNCTIGH